MSDIGRLFQLKLYSYKVTIQSRHKTKGKKKKKKYSMGDEWSACFPLPLLPFFRTVIRRCRLVMQTETCSTDLRCNSNNNSYFFIFKKTSYNYSNSYDQ